VAAPSSAREQAALRLSLVAAIVTAALAVVWGLLASSQIILFDGVYALIGIALGNRIPDKTKDTVTSVLGLVTMVLGGLSVVAMGSVLLRFRKRSTTAGPWTARRPRWRS